MEPWTIGPLNLGTLDPWNLETLEPWNLGPLDPTRTLRTELRSLLLHSRKLCPDTAKGSSIEKVSCVVVGTGHHQIHHSGIINALDHHRSHPRWPCTRGWAKPDVANYGRLVVRTLLAPSN